jgi:hypothetical protein
MSKITIVVNTLVLKGHTKTINLAEKHNLRKMPSKVGCGYGGINPQLSHLNIELIKFKEESLEASVLHEIKLKGIDINKPRIKNKNRGFALEFIFCVKSGHQCDFKGLYSECLDWLRGFYLECPIIHAVIHFDEGTPHMHVIIVPFVNNELQGDKIKRYVGESSKRNQACFNYIYPKYGLSFPFYLKGSKKQVGAELAIQAMKDIADIDLRKIINRPLHQSIYARPEGYLHALGINYDDVVNASKSTPT